MDNAVIFRSRKFRPFLPDHSQVNPGRYGAELSYWLSRQLAAAGVVTSYPNYEDWGWFIEYITDEGDEFLLCCSNVDDTDDRWLCFLRTQGKGLFGRSKPSIENAAPLLEALRSVIAAEPSIDEVEWSADRY